MKNDFTLLRVRLIKKLGQLKEQMNAEERYSDKWLALQQQYRALYLKIYGKES